MHMALMGARFVGRWDFACSFGRMDQGGPHALSQMSNAPVPTIMRVFGLGT